MALCVLVLAVTFLVFGSPWRVALTGGLAVALSLSSTAMVIAELQANKQGQLRVSPAERGTLRGRRVSACHIEWAGLVGYTALLQSDFT